MTRFAFLIAAAAALSGCMTAQGGAQDGAPGTADTLPGKAIFDSYCATCHGRGGRGDGPLAGDLAVGVPDLTLLADRNDGVFPVMDVMTQIHGYPGRYHQAMMPEFGPLLDGPRVDWTTPSGDTVPTPQALIDLAEYLRSLQRAAR